jgi:TonB family protein
MKSASTVAVEQSRTVPPGAAQVADELASSAASSPPSSMAGNSTAAVEKKNAAERDAGEVRSKESLPPEGGLLVYENGKEVFRMPPAVQGDSASANKSGVQRAAAVEPAGIVEISPEATEGSLLHRVEPEYPEEARQQRIQGAVALDVRIGSDGAVQDLKVVSGHRLLAEAAIAAVKQWRFKPQVRKGQAVEMQTRVTLNFRVPQ